ncbi:MAG: thioredoxin [Cyanobacteria bacterium P01_A01_bin.40]
MTNYAKYQTITPENFESEVINSNGTVLVDFWAPWCGPCQVMNPIIAGLAETWDGKVKVGKANVDENEAIATQYNIQAIPTIIIFQNGVEVERFPNLVSQAVLEERLSAITQVAA